MIRMILMTSLCLMLTMTFTQASVGEDLWLDVAGKDGPGKGKLVVLISGDEEYRTEEGFPMLAKILANHYGYNCRVVFPINPDGNYIDPNYQQNIPGLEALAKADLMVIGTRFRKLPDEQMAHIDKYLMSGKPVIGIRTATHAFNMGGNYARYSFNYRPKGEEDKAWAQGFGRLVLGETWISHHGGHKREATRGVVAPGAGDHAITNGIKDGDVWGPSDVYGVRLPLPGDTKHLILGQVTKRQEGADTSDRWFGMKPSDPPLENSKKNDPLMPVAWIKSYQLPEGGKKGKAFNTTMGASTDLEIEGTRRMVVNAALYLTTGKVPEKGAKVDIVGEYKPSKYGFHRGDYFKQKNMKVKDFK